MAKLSSGSPTSPVASKDVAQTFAESDVTLSHTDTAVVGESVELTASTASTGTTSSSGSYVTTVQYDVDVTSDSVYFDAVTVDHASSSDFTIEVRDSSDTVLASTSGSTGGAGTTTFTLDVSDYSRLLSSETATIYINEPGGNMPTADSEPGDTSLFSYVGGTGPVQHVDSSPHLSATREPMSGSVTVEWPDPPDIYAWDTALYRATEDGETDPISVDVQRYDGSEWVTALSDINNPASIVELPADQNIRYKVYLSRSSVSNNPTLDAIYRRFKL